MELKNFFHSEEKIQEVPAVVTAAPEPVDAFLQCTKCYRISQLKVNNRTLQNPWSFTGQKCQCGALLIEVELFDGRFVLKNVIE